MKIDFQILNITLRKTHGELFFFSYFLENERKEFNIPHSYFLMLDTSKDNSNATLESLFIRLFTIDETFIFSLFIELINVAKFEASLSNQWSLY
jgi:hypothetical protein